MRDATFPVDALAPPQIAAYLRRLELPLLAAESSPPAPSLELLSTVYLAHHHHVPKDTSPLHCADAAWLGPPSTPIALGGAPHGMPVGTAAYARIVGRRAGGYCWATNAVFACLLRGLGFRVSECAAKVYKRWAALDPAAEDAGAKERWGTFSHVVLVVDWEGGGEGRYVLDVGFGGGGCPIPMPLKHDAAVLGLNPYEGWTLRAEPLPSDPRDPPPIDVLPGWTMYRAAAPPGRSFAAPADVAAAATASHQYHFLLSSLTVRDSGLFDWYSQAHPLAAFPRFFLVTRLLPGTGGARRSVFFSDAMAADGRARVHTTGGLEGRDGTPRDVQWVEMQTGPMRACWEREFGFVFE